MQSGSDFIASHDTTAAHLSLPSQAHGEALGSARKSISQHSQPPPGELLVTHPWKLRRGGGGCTGELLTRREWNCTDFSSAKTPRERRCAGTHASHFCCLSVCKAALSTLQLCYEENGRNYSALLTGLQPRSQVRVWAHSPTAQQILSCNIL